MTSAIAARDDWQPARIERIEDRTPTIKSIFLRPASPFVHIAGQHVDVRLTAPDGYTAMRSYSIASAPDGSGVIELAIDRLKNGEVSPYFHEVAEIGDEIELRGPLGGHFIWPGDDQGPLLLIGGGSGVVPLMAMIRYKKLSGAGTPTSLLLSSRAWGETLYRDELIRIAQDTDTFTFVLTLTREPARRPGDFARRIDVEMIEDVVGKLPAAPRNIFVCGSNAFADAATEAVVAAGLGHTIVRTERYGG